MSKLHKVLLAVAVATSLTAVVLATNNPVSNTLGSVVQGGEYQATTTSTMGTNKHQLIQSAYNSSSVTLGSIVVASTSATTIKVWNATSTTDIASTTLGTLKASVAEGTYTFDLILTRGLILEIPTGFNGNYIITHR